MNKIQKTVYLSAEMIRKVNDIRRATEPIPSFSAALSLAAMAYEIPEAEPEEERYVYGSPEQIAELEKTDPEAAEAMRDFVRGLERSAGAKD